MATPNYILKNKKKKSIKKKKKKPGVEARNNK
jgi:hypothetical protein